MRLSRYAADIAQEPVVEPFGARTPTRLENHHVLISGAGIAGPTLAYRLLRQGWVPTLVERAPRLRTGGYMIDFWGVGYDVGERMNLPPALTHDGYTIETRAIATCSGSRARADSVARRFETSNKVCFLQFVYNVLRIPIAAGALDPAFGTLLSRCSPRQQ
jgi:hypothetical protein